MAEEDSKVLEAGHEMYFEDHFQKPDGSTYWGLKMKCPVGLPDGSEYLVGLITDVTNIKAAEVALRRGQARLQVINDVTGAMARAECLDEVLLVAVKSLASRLPDCRVSYSEVSADRKLRVLHSIGTPDLPSLQGHVMETASWQSFMSLLNRTQIISSHNILHDERYVELRAQFASAITLGGGPSGHGAGCRGADRR